MLFNSVTYIFLFLPAATLLYWMLPQRPRMWMLFIASLVFYGFWRVDFIPLVLFSALLDYFLAIAIDRIEEPRARRRLLLISVAANLLILGFFKYLVFFTESAFSVARLMGYEPGIVELKIILPLGISFYIFQTLSYTIDVYRREIRPERDMLKYMCFVTFFGHMVAGPILRARILLPQFEKRAPFEGALLIEGAKRILAGLFLKTVVADSLAGFVDLGFARNPGELGFIDAWTLAFMFGCQIYFDFAGYSHIAIGSAKLLGITLPENFNFPYAATSPREFWKRWHISLSTWIRDYLYLPLVGVFHSARDDAWDTMAQSDSASSGFTRARALFATWIIMGLWHGANWTFALWGFYHAVLVQGQRLLLPLTEKWTGWTASFAGFAVTLPLMMAGWVPFRCRTVEDAFTMWGRMLDLRGLLHPSLGLTPNGYAFLALVLLGMAAAWFWTVFAAQRLERQPALAAVLATGYHAVVVASVIMFLQIKQQFIYFQF